MQISSEKKLEMLYFLLLSRRFEETLTELCKSEGKIPGMMILCTGQEAVGAGVCAALEPADVIVTNHRSHSHLLAKGADPNALMAEIYGKSTGCNKGKSGTLHLAVPEVNAVCTTTVVGGGPPIAVGRAFSQQYRRQERVTVCFVGDGAANEGSFHEALNLASVWALPVIFVCENNLYAGAQRYEEHTKVANIADRAAAYPHSLSGGQQQRLGLCRALMLEPRLLLLDEPFSAVDPITRVGIYKTFAAVQAQEGVSTLLVTHDMREAVRLADYLVILKEGKVLQAGPTDEVLAAPADDYVSSLVMEQL